MIAYARYNGDMDAQLYIVSTPIGNLSDFSPRAQETLRAVDLIAAEDTRHSKRLLQAFDITTSMVPLHDHNERQQAQQLVRDMQRGQTLALISDAGTPLISDPGYRLVDAARDAALVIHAIPGPAAMIAAMSIAGLPSDRFTFEGFLPTKSGARSHSLENLRAETRTMIFYESPRRVAQTVAAMLTVFGPDRPIAICREISKAFEESVRLPLKDAIAWLSPERQRGEFVLVLKGMDDENSDVTAQAANILSILAAELPQSQAAKLTAKITGIPKRQLYNLLNTTQPS